MPKLTIPTWILAPILAAVPLEQRAFAQCLDWNPTFSSNGTDGSVRGQAVFDDGSGPALYVIGGFDSVGGTPATNIARWNGASWSAVGTGIAGGVFAITVYDDGSGPALYVGGGFTNVGGMPASHIAKWNGTSWSALAGGTNAPVRALCVFDDGPGGNGPVLCVGGEFWRAGDGDAPNIAKWNGGHWSSLGSGLAGYVYSLGVFDAPTGPELIAGGGFPQVNGEPSGYVARWDGSTWSPMGTGTNSVVRSLQQYDDGNGNAMYAAGPFTQAGGNAANHIARWDGSSWWPVGSGITGTVNALGVFDGGSGAELVVGGSFATVDGTGVNSIARWNGSSWSALGTGLDPGSPAPGVDSLLATSALGGPSLFVGGSFTHAGAVSAKHFARWDGSSWSRVGASADNTLSGFVQHFAVFDDGSGPALYAGGVSNAGDQTVNGIARWDGSSWSPVGGGVEGGARALCVFDDGSGLALYAASHYSQGQVVRRILKWDGATWSTLPGNPTANGNFHALAVFDDGSGPALYVGGEFSMIGGVPAARIAKWDGTAFSALGSGLSGISSFVMTIAVHDDGSGAALFAGGSFTSAGGTNAKGVAKWNGSSWSQLSSGIGGGVWTLASFDDGPGGTGPALYAGGQFSVAGGVLSPYVARWNGSSWSDLDGGFDEDVNALTVFDDGAGAALYAAGRFHTASGAAASHFVRWNGTSWSPVGGGLTHANGSFAYASAAAVYDDGSGGGPDLYVSGNFDRAGTTGAMNIAQWRGCGSGIAAFCTGDGSSVACPCANTGSPGRGCQNSAGTGGALLATSGSTQPDTIVLHASGELPNALSTFLQGNAPILGTVFGDGLRCAGGVLKRLYVKNASGGAADAPTGAEIAITARSAALGDPIAPGSTRYYQTYYRDPNLAYCAAPSGNSWNVTNGVKITW